MNKIRYRPLIIMHYSIRNDTLLIFDRETTEI